MKMQNLVAITLSALVLVGCGDTTTQDAVVTDNSSLPVELTGTSLHGDIMIGEAQTKGSINGPVHNRDENGYLVLLAGEVLQVSTDDVLVEVRVELESLIEDSQYILISEDFGEYIADPEYQVLPNVGGIVDIQFDVDVTIKSLTVMFGNSQDPYRAPFIFDTFN